MNFIQDGLAWFQNQRHEHTTQEVLVGLTEESAVPLKATVAGSSSQSSMDQVALEGKHFRFVFRRCDLYNANVKIQRGLKIWYKNNEFNVAFDKKMTDDYNDPMLLDITLRAVLWKEYRGIHPGSLG